MAESIKGGDSAPTTAVNSAIEPPTKTTTVNNKRKATWDLNAKEQSDLARRKEMIQDVVQQASSFGVHKKDALKIRLEVVGLPMILPLLNSTDLDDQLHAVEFIANLAVENSNHDKIVDAGLLDALFITLESSQSERLARCVFVALANLSKNDLNHRLLSEKGLVPLLVRTSATTHDQQTLRLVAAIFSNLCANEASHMMLKDGGAIQALVEMPGNNDDVLIRYVAQGLSNFANSEYQAIVPGNKNGPSPLLDHQVLTWLLANASTTCAVARHHISLVLCFLAQNEENAKEFVAGGGLTQLTRMSEECSEDHLRNWAKQNLQLNHLLSLSENPLV